MKIKGKIIALLFLNGLVGYAMDMVFPPIQNQQIGALLFVICFPLFLFLGNKVRKDVNELERLRVINSG